MLINERWQREWTKDDTHYSQCFHPHPTPLALLSTLLIIAYGSLVNFHCPVFDSFPVHEYVRVRASISRIALTVAYLHACTHTHTHSPVVWSCRPVGTATGIWANSTRWLIIRLNTIATGLSFPLPLSRQPASPRAFSPCPPALPPPACPPLSFPSLLLLVKSSEMPKHWHGYCWCFYNMPNLACLGMGIEMRKQ